MASPTRTPYISKNGIFVTFEDPISIVAKSVLAKNHGLAGVMLDELQDDLPLNPTKANSYALLSAIRHAWEFEQEQTTDATLEARELRDAPSDFSRGELIIILVALT